MHPRWPRPDVEFGHRLCRAYETYLLLHDDAQLSFEWAWNLLQCICYNDELYLAVCGHCDARYVQDAYALDNKTCPNCEIAAQLPVHWRRAALSARRKQERNTLGS